MNTETAWHETGHAIVGTLEGFTLEEVRIVDPPAARWAPWTRSFSVRSVVREALAGDIAERWRDRQIYRASDADLMFYIDAVIAKAGGKCDFCYAFDHISRGGAGDNKNSMLQIFREIEAQTIEIVTSRPVTSMIRAVAAQLMETPTLTGDEVRAIMRRFQ